MKIAFLYVNPGHNGIPIGLSYLISVVREKGHEASLFETTFYTFNYTIFNRSKKIDQEGRKIIDDFKTFVENKNPDLIGVSCPSLCLAFSIKMLESLKNRPPVIFGGVGATVDYMCLIEEAVVDYICIGYGEECLAILLEYLTSNKALDKVPNLLYKDNGKITKNEFSQSLDLEKLPVPDWSLFNKRHLERPFKREIKKWGNFQLTRGCPFNCSYCINDFYHRELGMKIYRFPVEKIVEEIETLSQTYQLDIIRIFDECFGFGNWAYYKKFAQDYKKFVNLPTIIETRPESITPEIIQVLKDINCISVSVGIEVGNEEQRREVLNRRVSNDTIKKAFELLHKAGIRTSSYNIIGFPHDTREKIFETIKLNRECRPDFINVFTFCPDPKTKLREYCLEKGLLDTDAITAYESESVIRNENLSKEELCGLFRTFEYYVKLPEKFYPMIKNAERLDEEGDSAFRLLKKEVTKRGLY